MLEGITPNNKKYRCAVQTVMATLDSNDKIILQEALNNPEMWPAKTLDKALRQRGVTLSDGSISHHRRKDCACWRI